MNLKRCANGHFYDADKHAGCPHCKPKAAESQITVTVSHDSVSESISEEKIEKKSTVPLQEAVYEAVRKPEKQNTVSQGEDDQKTVGFFGNMFGTEPVVGWLVCMEGDHYGESFPLKAGRNFIGRSANQDVVLAGDMSVSRERHAIVIYEPKARCFIAQPGDSRELFYLNDDVVLSNELLRSYDVLSIGNEKLLFVALCGPEFAWEDTK